MIEMGGGTVRLTFNAADVVQSLDVASNVHVVARLAVSQGNVVGRPVLCRMAVTHQCRDQMKAEAVGKTNVMSVDDGQAKHV